MGGEALRRFTASMLRIRAGRRNIPNERFYPGNLLSASRRNRALRTGFHALRCAIRFPLRRAFHLSLPPFVLPCILRATSRLRGGCPARPPSPHRPAHRDRRVASCPPRPLPIAIDEDGHLVPAFYFICPFRRKSSIIFTFLYGRRALPFYLRSGLGSGTSPCGLPLGANP